MIQKTRQARASRKVAAGIPVTAQTVSGVQITWLGSQPGKGVIIYAMVLYREPPQHSHPAALDDVVTAIRSLHTNGELREGHWVLAGDSAGGQLALSAAQQLRDTNGPMPAGLLLTAPLVDMELAHPDTVAAIDAAGITRYEKFWWAFKMYANGLPFSDPTLSPINASVARLPPVHLNVGTDDFFLHDVRRLRNALRDAGVTVSYIEQEGAEHVYALRSGTPQARWAVAEQIRWLRDVLSLSTPVPHTNS